MSTSFDQKPVSNILLVAITRLGDLLQASPTIVGMKEQFPGARLTVLVDRQFSAICKGIPGIDELYEVDLSMVVRSLHRDGDGIVDGYEYVHKLVQDLRAKNFDYCVNMASAGYTALLLKMIGIERSYGWTADDEGNRIISNPWSMLFASFVYHSNRHYNSINLVDVIRCSAGVHTHPRHLVYEIPQQFHSFPDKFLAEHGLSSASGPLVCLQAGASQEKRQWAPVKFARLLQQLVEEHGARVIMTGAAGEAAIIEKILSIYNHPNIASAVGKTNLGELAALLQRADALITGDTGPMHLAVAVGTPVIALFLASAYCFETGPYSRGNLIIQPQISCNPCNPNFSCPRPDCHDQITPEMVAYLLKLRLATSAEEVASLAIDETLCPPDQVAVYYSDFDEEGFLDFRRLNSPAARLGYHPAYFDAAMDAYRHLWKEEFGMMPVKDVPHVEATNKLAVIDHRAEGTAGLDEAINAAVKGVEVSERLVELIRNVSSPPSLLGEVNSQINAINRHIEDIGLAYPMLGALVRMFVMEQQNMQGADPVHLASEMKQIYENLRRRGQKFAKLFKYNIEQNWN